MTLLRPLLYHCMLFGDLEVEKFFLFPWSILFACGLPQHLVAFRAALDVCVCSLSPRRIFAALQERRGLSSPDSISEPEFPFKKVAEASNEPAH